MGTQITISSNASAVIRRLGRLRVQTIEQLHKEIEAMAGRVKRLMQKEGSPSVTPVNWDSERQRKFVMAKLRLENNIPYQRQGDYVNGWTIEPTATERGSLLKNTALGALFISGGARGDRQSNIHKGRWPLLRDAVDSVLATAPQYIYRSLRKLVKRD